MDSFHIVFGSSEDNPYDRDTIEHIIKNRRSLESKLFFDRLLDAIGLQNAIEHYPPKSINELKSLYNEITSASITDTHKAALLYYLRRDIGVEPKLFARKTCLPERYIILIDGLWCLDRVRLREALNYLTEPTLIPTFSEEILYTIAKHSPKTPALVLEYYNTASPVITSQKVLEEYFKALALCSVTEAFFFTRKQADLARKHLFEQLISSVHGSSSGEARAKRSVEFVGLPFNKEEEEWFEEYLLRGKGKGLFGAKDTVVVRMIATGRGDEVASLAKEIKERKIDGINWTELARGLAVD